MTVQAVDNLALPTTKAADFAVNKCFRHNTNAAKEMASRLLHIAKHDGVGALLAEIETERKTYCNGHKREALDELFGYVSNRAAMCDYPRYLGKGWRIGSGPTEAICEVLTYCLKGLGMRWDRFGADAIMALIALRRSDAWKSYWDSRKHAAYPRQNL